MIEIISVFYFDIFNFAKATISRSFPESGFRSCLNLGVYQCLACCLHCRPLRLCLLCLAEAVMLSRIGLRRGIFSYFFSQSRNREICNCFLGGGCFYYPKSRKSCGLVEITTFTEFSNVFNRSLTLNASFLPGTPIWVTRLDVFAASMATAVSTSGKVRWALRVWSFWPGLAELEIKPQDVMPAAEWALQALRLEGTGKMERNHLEKR